MSLNVENAAWAWLESQFGTPNDDPVDRAYAADEMVQAFHAGHTRALHRQISDAQAAGGGTSPTPPAVPPAQVPGGVPSPPGTIFLGMDEAGARDA